jgi:hypothetical protein
VSWATGDNVFLGRVPRDSVIDRGAWEFYDGDRRLGHPRWTKDENGRSRSSRTPTTSATRRSRTTRGWAASSCWCRATWCRTRRTRRRRWSTGGISSPRCRCTRGPTPLGALVDLPRRGPLGRGRPHPLSPPDAGELARARTGLSGSLLFAGDYVKRKAEHYGFMTQQFRLVPK